MSVKCSRCPLRKLPVFHRFTDSELEFMEGFKTGELSVEAGATIIEERTSSAHLFTALSGFGVRSRSLPDGSRQIVNFVLPGDFVGLQSAVLSEMDHGVEAVTPMVFCVFSRERFWELFKRSAERAYDIAWIAAREERTLGEMLTAVGRKSAVERVASFVLWLTTRTEELKMCGRDGAYPMPWRQHHVADALGLSLVHTNKTIRKLEKMAVLEWSNGHLFVLDASRLADLSGDAARQGELRPLV